MRSGLGALTGRQPPDVSVTASPPLVAPPILPSMKPPVVLNPADRLPRSVAGAAVWPIASPPSLPFEYTAVKLATLRAPLAPWMSMRPDTVPRFVVVLTSDSVLIVTAPLRFGSVLVEVPVYVAFVPV